MLPSFAPRTRRTLTTSAFLITFIGSVLTVSASSALPCPARNKRHQAEEQEQQQATPRARGGAGAGGVGLGERADFRGRKGWIQVVGDEPDVGQQVGTGSGRRGSP